jgi:hypothetical protein
MSPEAGSHETGDQSEMQPDERAPAYFHAVLDHIQQLVMRVP